MKLNSMMGAVLVCVLASGAVWAEKGEYWEVNNKMEMKGMPFAMPAQAHKVCLAMGAEKDPQRTQKDSNCQMTDIKTSGNTVRWKMKCMNDGEPMTGEGESTHERDSYHGNMRMKGKSRGEPVEMVTSFSGKRIGGSCDTEAQAKQAKAQMDSMQAEQNKMLVKTCDTSGYKTGMQWASSAGMFLGEQPLCPGKKDALCKALRSDVPNDVNAFEILQSQEQSRRGKDQSAVQACGLNMDSIKKTLCKNKAYSGPESFLDRNCPAEAKLFREYQRKREACEGRGYTAGAKLKECMGGAMPEEGAEDSSAKSEKLGNKADKSGKVAADAVTNEDKKAKATETILDGANKLKGMFGF